MIDFWNSKSRPELSKFEESTFGYVKLVKTFYNSWSDSRWRSLRKARFVYFYRGDFPAIFVNIEELKIISVEILSAIFHECDIAWAAWRLFICLRKVIRVFLEWKILRYINLILQRDSKLSRNCGKVISKGSEERTKVLLKIFRSAITNCQKESLEYKTPNLSQNCLPWK